MMQGLTSGNELVLAKLAGTSRSGRAPRKLQLQDWRGAGIDVDKYELVIFWGRNAESIYVTETQLRQFANDILNTLPVDDDDDYVNDCLANQEVI